MSVTIVDLIDAQVARTPRAIAVVSGPDRLTYAELDERADRLARRLRGLGAGPGRLVGVCLERSAGLVVAVLGVLKSGAAYLPLATDQPLDRLVAVVEATGLTAVLAHGPLAGVHVPTLAPDATSPVTEHEEPARPAPGDAAYVIHTSGSTGTPKGVVVEHRSLLASTLARQAWYQRPPGGFLLLSPLSFDSSVAGLFWTLTTGGRLVVSAEGAWQRLDELAGDLGELGVTHLLCVPSLYRALLDAAPAGALRTLDTVIVAGEACPAPLIGRHRAAVPGVRLVNEYGPTEATVWATAHDLTTAPSAGPVPIGAAVGHVTVHLVDERLSPVPDGAVGEILIGGAGVARGYAGNPALTAERFVADPFGPEPGGRLYRTGDLARRRPDGALEFLGRADQQIKINGVRIELGEIEAALAGHPEIREAAVLASGTRLTAYVTAENGVTPSPAGLRAFLASKLPAVMLPAGYLVLPDLPRNGNGKVDRAALATQRHPEPPAAPGDGADHLTALQRSIAEIWAEVLDRPVAAIGIDQNFFDAGGQSLLLLRVRRHLERVLGHPVPVTSLLAHTTVGSLARHLGGAPAERDRATTPHTRGRATPRPRRRTGRPA